MKRILGYLLASIAALVALFALCVLWPAAQAPLPDAADTRLIRNVRIVDVEQGVAGAPTDVLVQRGVIARIGVGLEAGPRVPVLEGGGRWLLPGFQDMHVHAFQLSPQLHFPLFVANGVTAVRDMMDCPDGEDALIACVADKRRWTADAATGRMTAPRFVQVASFHFNDPAMTPEDAAALAVRYRQRGLDALKVYNRVPEATYLRLAGEAQRLRMSLVGHLPQAVELEQAVTAGQSSFEHAHLFVRHCFSGAAAWRAGALDAEDPVVLARRMVATHDAAACARAFERMRVAGSAFVPTHVTREEDARAGDAAFLDDPRLGYLDPLSRWAYGDDLAGTRAQYPGARGEAALRGYFEHGLALTGAAWRAGVPVLVGTDTAIGGFRYHDEMAWLVRAGLPPAAVLRAATLDAARHTGQQDRHGTVEVGKLADLVLLDADPLQDIANTRRIHAVLLGGRLYDRARLDALLRFTHRQARSPATAARLLWGFLTSSIRDQL